MLIKTDPDILTVTMINDYFKNVRTFCTQSLTSEHEAALLQTGNLMLISIIGHIIHSAESERQIELFQQIQRRFMLILRDYDREWIWELLGTFSKNLPEQMLN